ncbi:MAG: hypothetical protein WED10_03360 [Brumimicrobium sp.]
MKQTILKFSLIFTLLISLTSCFELIEDTKLNDDGSGTYKITLNLSASQTRLNSVMALDSIDGKKIPSEAEMQKEVTDFVKRLNEQNGIKKATASLSTDEWILKFSCDFESLQSLQSGLNSASQKWQKEDSQPLTSLFEIQFNQNAYSRELKKSLPEKWKEKALEDEDYSKLKEGKCVFIQRFENPVTETSNKKIQIAKNQTACMLMLTPYEIINQPSLLNYSIEIDNE